MMAPLLTTPFPHQQPAVIATALKLSQCRYSLTPGYGALCNAVGANDVATLQQYTPPSSSIYLLSITSSAAISGDLR